MLDTLINCASSGTGRQILNWTRFVNITNLRTEIIRSRYIRSPFVYTNGTNLLIHIINGINLEEYKKLSDIDKYLRLEKYASQIRNKFDPVYTQHSLKGHFVEYRDVPEYILNCTSTSPLMNLPIDKDWEYWQQLRPMMILWHDSNELNLELWRYKIPFPSIKPSYVFYSLDVPLLLIRYIKYCEYCDAQGVVATPEEYIHDHVVYFWFDDLLRIWYTHIIMDMVTFNWDPANYKSQDIITSVSPLVPVYPEVRQIATFASKKALSVGDVFATKWFGHASLYNWIETLQRNVTLPPFNQYIALEFIANLPYYKFIVEVMQLINRRDIETPARVMLYDLRMYQQRNISTALYDINLKRKINTELSNMIRVMKNIVSPW